MLFFLFCFVFDCSAMRRGTDDYHEHLLVDDSDSSSRQLDDDMSKNGWSPKSALGSDFNHWPHVFNLTNCIVGVSVLAMPYCLQQAGLLK